MRENTRKITLSHRVRVFKKNSRSENDLVPTSLFLEKGDELLVSDETEPTFYGNTQRKVLSITVKGKMYYILEDELGVMPEFLKLTWQPK